MGIENNIRVLEEQIAALIELLEQVIYKPTTKNNKEILKEHLDDIKGIMINDNGEIEWINGGCDPHWEENLEE